MNRVGDYILNMEDLDKCLRRENHIVIYGAGDYGRRLIDYMVFQKADEKIKGIVVTKKKETDLEYRDKKVWEANTFFTEDEESVVIVAVSLAYRDDIAEIVNQYGNPRFYITDEVYRDIKHVMAKGPINIIEKSKARMKKEGVHILTAYFGTYSPKTAREKYRNLMNIQPHMAKSLWNIPRLHEEICKVEGRPISYEEWHLEFNKKQWEYIRIDGREINKKCFGRGENKIYLIGPCIVGGRHVRYHEESLGGLLYRKIEEMGFSYSIVCIVIDRACLKEYEKIFKYLMITENDIVVVMMSCDDKDLESDIPIGQMMDKRTCDWFYNTPIHTNYTGNLALAEEIADNYLAPICRQAKENPKCLQRGREFLSKEEKVVLEGYVKTIRKVKHIEPYNYVGAIVMNCNPMTKGHYYLIEEARKRVDYLYLFVVQENKSEFTFQERFDIVVEETAQMENVIVVPSGEFILSYSTMPLYFEKEEKKSETLDATNDLRIFGAYVAPALGITERFVGEEPIDMVTKQYNDEMKKILPSYRIKVTEIPRIKMGDVVVSASRVRALMNAGRWKELQELVTEGVYKRLRERCRNFYES